MIKKDHVHLRRPTPELAHPGEEEATDAILGQRPTLPANNGAGPHPPDCPPSESQGDISSQLDALFKRARTVLEPQPRPVQGQSVIGLLRQIEQGEKPEDFQNFLGDSHMLDPAEPPFNGKIVLLGEQSPSLLYKLLEKPMLNLKWRPEGR